MLNQEQNLEQQLSEVIYTPESLIRRPQKLFKEMWQDLLVSRELAWRLLVRDLSAQYRQSLLGIVWAFVPPIVAAVGLTIANNAKVINIGATDLPYPAYVIFSMTLWQLFVEALNSPIGALTKARMMLTKIKISPESIVVAELGQVFFNFGIKLLLIVGTFIWFRIQVNWKVILAPIALVQLVILGTCLGLFLAPLAALYHDIPRALGLIIGVWMFLTPVIYPVPQKGFFGVVVRFNPVTPLLVTTRELATTGNISNLHAFWIVSGIGLIGLLLGWMCYRLALPYVVERFSA